MYTLNILHHHRVQRIVRENVIFMIITNTYPSIRHSKIFYSQYLLLLYIVNCTFFHPMSSMFRIKMNPNDSNLDYCTIRSTAEGSGAN